MYIYIFLYTYFYVYIYIFLYIYIFYIHIFIFMYIYTYFSEVIYTILFYPNILQNELSKNPAILLNYHSMIINLRKSNSDTLIYCLSVLSIDQKLLSMDSIILFSIHFYLMLMIQYGIIYCI